MRTGKLLAFGCFAAIGIGLMSCSKADVFDSNAANELKKEQQERDYTSNFVKKYGAVEGKSWDFSSMRATYSLPSSKAAGTRAASELSVTGGKNGDMTIEKSVIDEIRTKLKAGTDNTVKGSPFYMVTQETSFTIVPIFQGQAGYYWQLGVNIGGTEKILWSKGDMKYRESATSTTWSTPGDKGVPANAYEVKAPKFTYTATKDVQMYFFLKVWTNGTGKGTSNYRLTSLDHMMLAMDCIKKPAGVPADNDVTIIGCEDNPSATGSDKDFEDLVFMMYGKPAPPVKHVDEVEVTEAKRYMMEDLGADYDFDFNDVVVDVSNTYMKKVYYHYDNRHALVFDREEEIAGTRKQEAIIRAAGGTLDFTLQIGTKTWTKKGKFTITDMLNTGWNNTEIDYNGVLDRIIIDDNSWNPDANNISVTVQGRGEDQGVKTITFPKEGAAPMIIAVDPTNEWMKECVSVPTDWFTE